MAENIKYWSNVFKRVFYIVLAIIGLYLGYKFAIFYMPFLIAFLISTIMEPAIRFLMKKFNLTRKFSSIIIFIITFGIIISRTYMGDYNFSF
jgi:predicted PurR-regulated permease PerM